MFLGVATDAVVRCLKSLEQGVLRVVDGNPAIDVADGFDSQTTGLLPSLVAAHAIGNYRQPALAQKIFFGLRLPVG